jgi:hypothetical protein
MNHDELRLRVAQAICAAWDEPWGDVPKNGASWLADYGGRDRTMPRQDDYLVMAEAAINAIQTTKEQ